MLKKKVIFLLLCLFFVSIITSACGGGGGDTTNSANYYVPQQITNNNQQYNSSYYYYYEEQESDPSPTPAPSPTPDPSPTPETNPFIDAQVGDYVKFGRYRQTGDGDNVEKWEPKPIEWQVLVKDTDNNRVLAISRYGIEHNRFDDDSTVWKDSEICSLLNGDFYNTAFTETEKGFINSTELSDVDSSGSTYNVFLLSKDEADRYFANDEARICEATDYAQKKVVPVPNPGYSYSSWWLRSTFGSSSVSIVHSEGSSVYYVRVDTYHLVRPALWIKL